MFFFLENSIFAFRLEKMAGIYIHVPFCSQRCAYCDFYSQTNASYKHAYIRALVRELELRADYLKGESVETIYFGGGTPSQLQADDFKPVFYAIDTYYDTSRCHEVTLEANPDDLTMSYLRTIDALPFNRISIGVQSFDDDDLRMLNRRHDRKGAIEAVSRCRDAGFSNLSLDLIYGLPNQTAGKWQENLEEVFRLEIPHLSAYHLSYEEGTPLYRSMKAGTVVPVDEEKSVLLYRKLIEEASAAGYLHYEISNFCRPESFSRHNSSYWTGERYLGAGPAAHSYDGSSRQWNVSSLPRYINALDHDLPYFEKENLDEQTRYNEYILTRLRTMWGIRLSMLRKCFGAERARYFERQASPYLRSGILRQSGDSVCIAEEALFTSDGILCDLML